MKQIIDGIFLSDLPDALDIKLIKANRIGVVCRLSEFRLHPSVEYYSEDLKIEYHSYVLRDELYFSKELIERAKQIYAVIMEHSTENILVHCDFGQSRSVSAIIYYLQKRHGYTYVQALTLIKNIKEDAQPNYGFEMALRMLDPSKNDFEEQI